MNLQAAAVVLRPRTLSEVFDLACMFGAGSAARTYAALGLWVLVPPYLACLALRHVAGLDWVWVWLVAVGLGVIAQGPFTIGVGRMLFSERPTALQAIGLYWRAHVAHTQALLRYAALLVLVGWTGVMIPWAAATMLYVHEASLLEGQKGAALSRRCAALVRGRMPSALLVVLLLTLSRAGAVVLTELLCQALVDDILQLGQPFGTLWSEGGTPFALFGFFLSVPYVATARFLQYVDTRTRADGWDVQLKLMAVAARQQEGGR